MHYSTRLQKIASKTWNLGIDVPKEIADELKQLKISRVVCRLNDVLDIQTGIMPNGDIGGIITLNTEVRKQLNLIEGCVINVELKEDTSKYGLPVPEEFEELLLQDEEFNILFHKLTPGKQRSLIHMAGVPKSSDMRLKKTLTISTYLKSTNGRLDYKELNEAFKRRV